jgi:chromosome segregation ATPase
MSSKTCKRYPPSDALKKGCASTIESACIKLRIAQEYVELRDKYKLLKTEYQKSKVKLEQMEQLKKDNDSKLIQLTKKNDTINKLHTNITQLNSDIRLLKDTSVDRADAQRLEGKLKKKDQEIEELKKQIDSTKINALTHLENQIVKLKAENQKIKEGDCKSRFDMIRVLSDDIKKVSDENIQLKKDNETLKAEHGELITKVEKFEKVITDLYDDF